MGRARSSGHDPLALVLFFLTVAPAAVAIGGPTPVDGFASVVVGNMLWIHGGDDEALNKTSRQLWSLSLGTSFSMASPPWVDIVTNNSPFADHHAGLPASDGISFVLFGTSDMPIGAPIANYSYANLFNTQSNTWTPITT